MSFYQSGQPLIIPDPVDVGVQSVSAGSNVTVTGTALNPIINAVGTVASIIAGSNISVSGTSNVTINATGGGSSSSNISHFGVKSVVSTEFAENTFVELFQISPDYFSNANSSYLLKTDWYMPSATCSNVSGNVSLFVTYGATNLSTQSFFLLNQSSWANTSNLNYSANLATTFIPNQGTDTLIFYINNHTTGTITGSLEMTISITGLTTSNINANNWPVP